MSYLPTPPIKDFYEINGKYSSNRVNIRYDRVYHYLNSLFGETTPNYTSSVAFRMPSLAVPAIFEEPTQRVSVNENSLDPNIRPFTLYYFFNAAQLLTHTGMIGVKKNWAFDSGGKFVFIVPEIMNYEVNNSMMVIFSRQSSKSWIRGERFSWKTESKYLPSRFRNIQSTIAVGGKPYNSYKVLNAITPKARTLNYSRRGFQT